MRITRTPYLFLFLALISFGFTSPPQVQGGFDVVNPGVAYNFGQQITFTARLVSTSGSPVMQATISFRDINEQTTRVAPLTVANDGSTSFQYDASQNVLPPFGVF